MVISPEPYKKRHLILLLLAMAALCSSCTRSVPEDTVFKFASTIAGTNGELGEAFGVAVSKGDIYISDGQNGKIWKLKGGQLTVFAEGLDTPSGIAFDRNGNLIVADAGSNTIRSISPAGAMITLAGVAGKRGSSDGEAATALFNAPVGVAIMDDGGVIVADTYNDRIRFIKDGVVSTLAGSTEGFRDGNAVQAQFDTPCGIAFWGGKIFVADAGNARLRIIEPDRRVWTVAGTGQPDLKDGPAAQSSFIEPTAIAITARGTAFVADNNAIRKIDLQSLTVTTLGSGQRGLADGEPKDSRFDRPSGLALDVDGSLVVADTENRVVRRMGGQEEARISRDQMAALRDKPEDFRSAAPGRWPYDPPDAKREIAGTLGEIRGDTTTNSDDLHFHNGVDIAGAYGETARFVRDEKVLRPIAVDGFNTLRENIRMPTMGYIHIRLGRDKDGVPFADPRFQFLKDAKGKIAGVRIPRGAAFKAGDPIGTLNAMNHVHLIAGRSGSEMNALDALVLPRYIDTRPPVIQKVSVLPAGASSQPTDLILNGNTRVEMNAYDQVDGNADRRRLGIYQAGYQILRSDLSPIGDIKWTISFARIPAPEAVTIAYAKGSKSGATGETIFDYIVTNQVDGDNYSESYFDPSVLDNGSYVLRVFAADEAGNKTYADTKFEVRK